MYSRISHRIFLFFIQSRSSLRTFMKNQNLRHDSREYIASYIIEPTYIENYGCSMISAIPFTLVNASLQSAPRNITHPRPSSVQNSSFNIS